MAKMWKTMCKTLRVTMCEKCAEKSGKNLYTQTDVDKISYSHCFTKKFHMVLRRSSTSYKRWVFHVFHIAYYYNY